MLPAQINIFQIFKELYFTGCNISDFGIYIIGGIAKEILVIILLGDVPCCFVI